MKLPRILLCLIWLVMPVLVSAQEEPVRVSAIELMRRGKQVSVHLRTSRSPVYEVAENLAAKTIVIKLKNTLFNFKDGRKERLFNDDQIAGIRFLEVEEDLWAQFKLRQSGMSYAIEPSQSEESLQIVFRPSVPVEKVDEGERKPRFLLAGLGLDSATPDSTAVTFSFRRAPPSQMQPDEGVKTRIPRIFLMESSDQTSMTIRFPDTFPDEGLEVPEYEDPRLRLVGVRPEVNQTFADFEIRATDVRIERRADQQERVWRLEVFGSVKEAVDNASTAEELSEEEKKLLALTERDRLRRRIALKNMFQQAENTYRNREYGGAIRQFQAVYAQGKAGAGEFEEPMEPIALRAMFRSADVIYTMLERSGAKNHHRSIDVLKAAVRIARDNEEDETEEGGPLNQSLIPHALFRIGRSYQKMQFHGEAGQYFNQLRKEFPNSMEAVEAIFWKAVTQVNQRNWEQAVQDFKEYLSTSPSPKHLAETHYKLAQAYYQLRRFITAREHFDQARDLNPEYARQEPTLLFHMGETYYENADYTTAREVFKILLQLYPDADFTKFVAVRLGDFLRDEGKEDEAIQAYRNAINSYSREIALLGKLRIANIQSQRPYSNEYLEAIMVYDELISLYPDSEQAEEAMLRKGLTQTLYGFYEPAIKTLESFMERYPQSIYVGRNVVQENIDENLKGMIDQHFQKEDYLTLVAAYRDYKSKYMLKFRFNTTLFQVAVAHRSLGLFDDALDLLRFLESRSEEAMGELIQFEMAQIFYEQKNYAETRNKLAQFLQQYPQSPYDADAWQLLARVYWKNNEFSKALIVYEKTIEKYDQVEDLLKAEIVPELFYELGQMLEEAGYFNESANAYLQAVDRYRHPVTKPDTPLFIIHSHFLAGEMLYKVENNESALAQFEKTISLYQERKEPEIRERIYWALYHSGNLYAQQGQEEKALNIYKDLIDTPEGEGSLWKKMAVESYQSLANQMNYEDYLNQ